MTKHFFTPRQVNVLRSLGQQYDQVEAAKDALNRALVDLEVAKRHLEGSIGLAKDNFNPKQIEGALIVLTSQHPGVQYLGLPIGAAATAAVFSLSTDYAEWFTQQDEKTQDEWDYPLVLDQEAVVKELERGGYEFKGSPGRELHAGLMKSEIVTKVEGGWVVDKDTAANSMHYAQSMFEAGTSPSETEAEYEHLDEDARLELVLDRAHHNEFLVPHVCDPEAVEAVEAKKLIEQKGKIEADQPSVK